MYTWREVLYVVQVFIFNAANSFLPKEKKACLKKNVVNAEFSTVPLNCQVNYVCYVVYLQPLNNLWL